jgi:YbgC/YbaW family acyl-CoA thioester hydrolase
MQKPMQPTDFRCLERTRVRWAEVDLQKIVFNAHYLTYVDNAMAAYWRHLAVPYEATMAMLGGDVFLKTTTVTYHAPARYDDVLDVGLRCVKTGRSSMHFEAGIWRNGELLTDVQLVYVYADPTTNASRPLPETLVTLIQDFEAGREVMTLTLGDWDTIGPAASHVRSAVFVEEQGISREDEWDAADANCQHAVITNRFNQPLATGRLLPSVDGVSTIGRMAVLRPMRGTAYGRMVLSALCKASAERGDRRVELHAQRSAEAFYARQGFAVVGEPYDEVGIPHVTMTLTLQR